MNPHQSIFNPTERMLRQFAGIWIPFFGAAAAIQQFLYHRHQIAVILVILAVTIGPLGLAWPRAIKPVFVGWMTLAYPVGWMVSRVILGILFLGLFTPVGWLLRKSGKDELGLKRRPHAQTYWLPKPAASDKSKYLSQF
jgi:hypothetical protein